MNEAKYLLRTHHGYGEYHDSEYLMSLLSRLSQGIHAAQNNRQTNDSNTHVNGYDKHSVPDFATNSIFQRFVSNLNSPTLHVSAITDDLDFANTENITSDNKLSYCSLNRSSG